MIGLLALLQLAATPIAQWYTRRALRNLTSFDGTVGEVRASVFPPTYALENLRLTEREGPQSREPLLQIQHVMLRIAWRQLLHGALVANVELDAPHLHVVTRAEQARPGESPKSREDQLAKLEQELELQTPLKVNLVEIHRGAVTVIETSGKPMPKLELTHLELSISNLATRAAEKEHQPTVLDGHGVLQRTGVVTAKITADPWAKGLNFDGRVSLRNLQISDLRTLVEAATQLKPTQGTIDLFADFKAKNGHITGGVKPVLHDVELAPANPSPWTSLKAWVADLGLDLFSSHRGSDQKKLATVVPIRGTVDDPQAQLWPTIMGVVRNAFVEGVTEGFANVPPQTAEKKQNPVEQLGNALNKQKGPPKAQPPAPTRQGRH
ncbi:MAG: DUF748 domain-containing protein [Deltaproteobacteria bacterium]|nr:DUF748 domain-containing protein [Deltaproteobacteria bacterium]